MILCFVLIILATINADGVCQRWSHLFEKHLASKTPYRVVSNENQDELIFDGCQPIKFWMFSRHGTRLPSKKTIKIVNEKLKPLVSEIIKNPKKSLLCDEVIESFKSWEFSVTSQQNHDLVHEGEEELLGVGERYQNRLPNLLSPIYSSKYQFRSTNQTRAQESMKHFMIGLFGRGTVQSIWPMDYDPSYMKILRFYKACEKWASDVKKNPDSLNARNKFEESEAWRKMLADVSARLGFGHVLDTVTISSMYTMCGYETAWNKNRFSPWCGVFTIPELELLELAEDIEYYHIDGYGHELNYQAACPATTDLINHFTSDNGSDVSVSFTHSGTILKLLARFGLYKDETWIADEDTSGAQGRTWRTSRIDAFASNLAFVLYRCKDEKKFVFLHQERVVPFPGCPGLEPCPLSTLVNLYGTPCNFSEICTLPKS